MPAIPLVNITVAQLLVKGTINALGGNTRPITLSFYYRRIATTIAPTKTALNTIFASDVYAPMLAAFSSRWVSGSNTIRYIQDATDPGVVFSLAGAGAIATDMMPSYVSVFMLLNTGWRGKSWRSGKHFPALPEADTVGDVLSGAGLVRWQAVQTALLAPLTDATNNTWRPCVFSPSAPSQIKTNPTTVVTTDVTQVVLNLTPGVMRKRKVKTVV